MAFFILHMFVSSSFSQLTECGYNVTPCDAYANADAVFIGKVTKIVPATIEIWQRDKDYDQTANISIEMIYKGIEGNSIVLHQLGRKNAPKFIAGSRYLFYANFDGATKKWEVKTCGRTRMANFVQDDLRYLNNLKASAKRSRIAGEVVRYETDSENPQGITERLAGIKLKLIGAGKEYETATDENGFYEAYDMPAWEIPYSTQDSQRLGADGCVALWSLRPHNISLFRNRVKRRRLLRGYHLTDDGSNQQKIHRNKIWEAVK